MTDRSAKEARLVELKAELSGVRGTPTEVYSRIVGYYRSVRNWNAGKRHEYTKRKTYEIAGYAVPAACQPKAENKVASYGNEISLDMSSAKASQLDFGQVLPQSSGKAHEAYLLFTRKTCPNCPPVRDYLATSGLKAIIVDVDTPEGFETAKKHNVMATPTAILLGSAGDELARAYTRAQLRAQLAPVRDTVRV